MDLDNLMKTYGDNLLRLCTLYLKDSKLAEDAVQETFLRAWKNRDAFREEASPKTWITRIAINICKNYLRTPWNRVTCFGQPKEELFGTTELDQPGDQTLATTVASLPKKYREIILLYYYQELSLPEIATVLEVNQSTCGVRLKRGRDLLRPMLKEWYYDE